MLSHYKNIGLLGQNCPPKPTYVPERDIPDLTGKVMIVTGGNTGIGKETVKELLKKNAKVYMGSRSKERAEAAINELKEETGKEAIFLQLDLADLDAVRRAADEFKTQETKLDVLFNSAGLMFPPIDQLTADGYDIQFGTNVLGHAHFTLCLIPELLEGAKASPDGKARVIHTSSSGAYFVGSEGIQYDTLRDGPARTKLGTQGLYFQSKYANVIFSNELAKLYGDQGIISNAVNPGNLKTELQRHVASCLQTLAVSISQPREITWRLKSEFVEYHVVPCTYGCFDSTLGWNFIRH
ncbi:hypothetical protein FRC02_004681 [Tulasnella sp. 418]|nr:hypothetical protein FRC02_004681 [Tulasnella sp. 418]